MEQTSSSVYSNEIIFSGGASAKSHYEFVLQTTHFKRQLICSGFLPGRIVAEC